MCGLSKVRPFHRRSISKNNLLLSYDRVAILLLFKYVQFRNICLKHDCQQLYVEFLCQAKVQPAHFTQKTQVDIAMLSLTPWQPARRYWHSCFVVSRSNACFRFVLSSSIGCCVFVCKNSRFGRRSGIWSDASNFALQPVPRRLFFTFDAISAFVFH